MISKRSPYFEQPGIRLYLCDCIEVMRDLPENSVDAVVTDPPYGINFMGKAWDGFNIAEAANRDQATRKSLGPHSETRPGREAPRSASAFGSPSSQAGAYDFSLKGDRAFQVWCESWAVEALRVLKPGGHLLAFGGTRTFHRLMCALEDAGFEVRDCLSWNYGSGFPKSLDVSKAIDKAAGAEREVVGDGPFAARRPRADHAGQGMTFADDAYVRPSGHTITVPATDAAKQWSGWGTALKPAWEPIILARKALEGNVADNVQKHGTGALNIDGCRIGFSSDHDRTSAFPGGRLTSHGAGSLAGPGSAQDAERSEFETEQNPHGRWPANVILDEEAAEMLDEQSGERTSGRLEPWHTDGGKTVSVYGSYKGRAIPPEGFGGDSGGASRFFYTAKADRKERWEFCTVCNLAYPGTSREQHGHGRQDTSGKQDWKHIVSHPTVKPLALIRWLCRLVTPPSGTILDPFIGSGTMAVAAKMEGFNMIGIDQDAHYLSIAEARVNHFLL